MKKHCFYCMTEYDGETCPHCGKNNSVKTALHQLPAGVVLNNRYLIGRVLGEGGFGITYIGKDMNLDMTVAVKEFFPVGYVTRNNTAETAVTVTGDNSEELFGKGRARFINEARVLAKFSGNKSIVDVRDYFESNNTAYIVMEYIQGITLSRYIKSHGVFETEDLFSRMLPIFNALRLIHAQGLIHRDISPDNIMILADGSLKLMDFGAARDVNFEDKRSLSIVLRQGYAPVEQYRSKGVQGPWTDIYAICATIYKCVTGVTPDESMERVFADELKRPSQLGIKIPAEYETALMKGLSVYQNERYQSVDELLDDIISQNEAKNGAEVIPIDEADDSDIESEAPTVSISQESEGQTTLIGSDNSEWKTTAIESEKTRKQTEPAVTADGGQPKPRKKKLIPLIAGGSAAVIALAVTGIIIAANSGGSSGSIAKSEKAAADLSGIYNSSDSVSYDDSESVSNDDTDSYTEASDILINNPADEAFLGGEDDVQLKIWAPEAEVNLTKSQIKKFIDSYPDKSISVEIDAVGAADASTYALSSGSLGADVFVFSGDQTSKLVNADALSEVPEDYTDYVKSANTEKSADAVTANGSLYAYPQTVDSGYCLVFDTSVVSYDQAETLEDILAACKSAGKKFIIDCSNSYFTCSFAMTGGVLTDGFESDGETQRFVDYDEDEAAATLQAFSKLMHDYKGTFVSKSAAQIASGFSDGTVGAAVDGTWNYTPDREALGSRFGYAKLPSIKVNGARKQMISMFGYKYIGVSSYSSFPKTAHALALFLSGEQCQRENAEELDWVGSNLLVQSEMINKGNMKQTVIIEQNNFAQVQTDIANTFWSPMEALGKNLIADATDPSGITYFRLLLQETVSNIRDE